MSNTDYIKEKLNTLRIEFMAQILMIIALIGGLSKMTLDGFIFDFSEKNYLYSFGILFLLLLTVSIVLTMIQMKTTIKKLKDL